MKNPIKIIRDTADRIERTAMSTNRKEGYEEVNKEVVTERMSEARRKKVLLFYNPYSGNDMFRNNLDRIIERFQHEGMQVVPVRAAKGYAIEKALDEIRSDEYRQIIAAGGDGTINICVNTMIRHNIDLPLALFPAGTANDFAYYFQVPTDLEGMMDVALGDNTVQADVGVCNDRYFINVAAMGSLIDVSQKTDPNLKNTIGALAYYLNGATEIKSLKPIPVTLTTPDKVYNEKIMFMVVMNGKSAGGFRNVSPLSEVNDGKLDVIVFKEMSILELTTLLPQVMQGNHIKHRKVMFFETPELTIESDEYIPTDVDGEHGEELPLHFSVLPGRLRILSTLKEEEISRKHGRIKAKLDDSIHRIRFQGSDEVKRFTNGDLEE